MSSSIVAILGAEPMLTGVGSELGPSSDRGERLRVILVPGILEPPFALWPLALRLRWRGFRPAVYGYRSTRRTLEEHAPLFLSYVARKTHQFSEPFALVGHSMGGLLIRAMLAHHGQPAPGTLPGLRAVVFLGTPHRGARLAEELRDVWWFRWLFGNRAAAQLAPGHPFHRQDTVPRVPFGTIAGGTGGRRGRARWIVEDNDRVVEVSSTHLDGEADWLLLPTDHQGMLHRRATADAVATFLRTGKFSGRPEAP